MPNLLDLPDELLLDIAHSTRRLNHQKSLCSLSLANKRLQKISEDALYHAPIVRIHHSRQLVAQVLKHPELADRIVCLEVLDKPVESRPGQSETDDIDMAINRNGSRCGGEVEEPSEETIELTNIMGAYIRAKGLNDDSMRWAAGLQDHDPFAWFAALLILVPNLKRLTLSNFITRNLGRKGDRRGFSTQDLRPFLVNILHHVSPSVESLTIDSTFAKFLHYNHGERAFSPIPWVKHVNIPMDILDLPLNRPLSKEELSGLPRHMETLQIRDCNKTTIGALACLGMLIRNRTYASLKSVRVQWSHTLEDEIPNLQVLLGGIKTQFATQGVNFDWNWGTTTNFERLLIGAD